MIGRNYTGPWRRTPGRLLGTGLVRLYQLTFSPLVGGHCRHIPTCSEYAYEAIARHGLLRGGWLAAGALCVLEEGKGAPFDRPAGFELLDERPMGESVLRFLRLARNENALTKS